MASLHNDLRTVSRCTAVQDEFNDIDDVFWSVVNSLPPDSPFIRHLTAMFQESDPAKQPKPDDDQHSESEDETQQSGQGDGVRPDRVLRSRRSSPATSKTPPAPPAEVTRSQDDHAFYDAQAAADERVERRPHGSYICYSDPGSKDKYLISTAPAYAADYATGEAPLCALPTEVYAALLAAYQERFPDKQLEVLGVSVTSTLAEPPRSKITFSADAVRKHMRNKTPMPSVFEHSLNMGTWKQVKAAWSKVEQSLDKYMGSNVDQEGNRTYTGARPLVFMEGAARKAKYFVVNIYYNNITWCVACRHKTYLHDQHPWCMVCTVMAGYWPCVGGKYNAVCLHCKDYSVATQSRCLEEWKRISDPKNGFNLDQLFSFRPRLPVPLVTQFDATVSTIIRDQWKEDFTVGQDPGQYQFITAYHIKRPSRKQQPKQEPELEEGEVPPPDNRRRSKRRTQSAGARTSTATTAPPDTDTEDTEAALLQSALERSLIDARAPRGRERQSAPGPSAPSTSHNDGSPAKKSRKSGDKLATPALHDYMSLNFPWWFIARALMSQTNFKPVHYNDGEDGCIPDDSSTVDMQQKLTQIWLGELPVYCRYNEDGRTWGLVYAPRGTQYALPVPSLPVPTATALLPKTVKPVSFSYFTDVPVRFRDIYNLRTVDWPQFVEDRIQALYRPMLPHLHAVDRWMPLLPDDFHDPTVTMIYDVANLTPVINAPAFARSWKMVEEMDAAGLRHALKQFFSASAGLPILTHTHIWWRRCARAMFAQHEYQPQRHLGRPMLLPLHVPDDPVVPLQQRRPTIAGMTQLPRPAPLFAGLTPTAISFLTARAEEQATFVGRHGASSVHSMTYRSQRMRLYTAPYLENQDAAFPLDPLHIPDSAAWGRRLATPLDFNVAYPITDVSLCYSEALGRLLIYQLSHREQTLSHLDFAFQQLVQIIAVMNPSFLERAQTVADQAVARQWHLLQDDYATATELLQTTVHQRRQGFLSFASSTCLGDDRVQAAQRPIVGETRVLVPRVPSPPPPPPRPQSPPTSAQQLKPAGSTSADDTSTTTPPLPPPAP